MSNHADNGKIVWPEKTGELYHNHFDSTLWNDFLFCDDDIKTFIHKGTNGRWRDVLTEEDIANYESRALEELGPECAHWLSSGEL